MWKRFKALFLLVAILSACAAPALAENTMQQGSMYVNTANGKALRFRSSRSTSADNVLTEIPYGTKVYVLDWDGTWARIRYNSAVGYVVKKHLSIARPESYETVKAAQEQEQAVRDAAKELKAANKKLDHSRLKKADAYDVVVRTGVDGLTANVYKKADLTTDVLRTYAEGAFLMVTSKNRDWALIYDPGTEETGYMLLEELEEVSVEEEDLPDDE